MTEERRAASLAIQNHARLGQPQKTALLALVDGASYAEAARRGGLRSTADLKRYAARFGLEELHRESKESAAIGFPRRWSESSGRSRSGEYGSCSDG